MSALEWEYTHQGPSSLPHLSLFSPSSHPRLLPYLTLICLSLSSVHLAPSSIYLPPLSPPPPPVSIPYYSSSLGYGFLWNSPALGSIAVSDKEIVWVANATLCIDLWISVPPPPPAASPSVHVDLLAQYSAVVGRPLPLPTWATGFIQCKDRYRNQTQLLDVARGYKSRKLPISMIVIDWFHWVEMGGRLHARRQCGMGGRGGWGGRGASCVRCCRPLATRVRVYLLPCSLAYPHNRNPLKLLPPHTHTQLKTTPHVHPSHSQPHPTLTLPHLS